MCKTVALIGILNHTMTQIYVEVQVIEVIFSAVTVHPTEVSEAPIRPESSPEGGHLD